MLAWNDAGMKDIKLHSVRTHLAWAQSGRPRSGELYEKCNVTRRRYRVAIAKHMKTMLKIT